MTTSSFLRISHKHVIIHYVKNKINTVGKYGKCLDGLKMNKVFEIFSFVHVFPNQVAWKYYIACRK
jgi:hypothetical protein